MKNKIKVSSLHSHAKLAMGMILVALAVVGFVSRRAVALQTGQGTQSKPDNKLYLEFSNPPRQYSIAPYWWWNGKLNDDELRHQIDEMVSQKVYSAIMFPFMGLETPYLSEAWFHAMGVALAEARKKHFTLNFDDEFEWPNGAARDIWMQDLKYLQSRTVKENPDFRMRSLAYVEKDGWGGKPIHIKSLPKSGLRIAIASRWHDEESEPGQDYFTARTYGAVPLDQPDLDPNSIRDVSSSIQDNSFSWTPPGQGRWRVMVFYLAYSTSTGQYVDVLSGDAMQAFIRLVYDQYYKRFSSYFGKTIKFIVSDGEGSYGYGIAWTPKLFATFQKRHGYDLRKYLPLLVYEAGSMSEKVRCDYMDTITALYAENNAGLITQWCEHRGVGHASSLWEDPLQSTEHQGSLMEVMRHASFPETDGLFDRGRDPRDYIESRSVADFKGTRYAIETSALLGGSSYLSPEKARVDANAFAAWELNLFIPHAFDYDPQKITYYPSWFYQQPWWKYFHFYADYIRRISYMNSGGRHVVSVALFDPTESVWAGMAPVFDRRQMAQDRPWKNYVDAIDRYYADIIRQLAAHQIDADAMDSHYLEQAKVSGPTLVLGKQTFRALVLPPVPTLPLAVMKKVEQFYDAGGIVFAMHRLPTNSAEHGKDDPEIERTADRVFGAGSLVSEYTVHSNSHGGKAYFVRSNVALLVQLLSRAIPRDVEVLNGHRRHFYALHRQKLGQDFYWVVNDSHEPRRITVRFAKRGIPERWDALTGHQSPLFYYETASGTVVSLSFGPWDAFYVVFRKTAQAGQQATLAHSDFKNLAILSSGSKDIRVRATTPVAGRDYRIELKSKLGDYNGEFHLTGQLPAPILLDGSWRFRPQNPEVPVFYAKTRFNPKRNGEEMSWARPDFPASDWKPQWLSPENFTIRRWYVVGPFPDFWDRGFDTVYLPEKHQDLQAIYKVTGFKKGNFNWDYWQYGPTVVTARWQLYDSPSYYVRLDNAIPEAIAQHHATGFHPSSGPVVYALTYVYSPAERHAQVRVTARNVKVWINDTQVISRFTNLYYMDMREYWGLKADCTLHAGWNTVLVKIAGNLRFMFRLSNPDGTVMPDLVASPTKTLPAAQETRLKSAGSRWYRVAVPPGTLGMKKVELPEGSKVFLNGHPLAAQGETWNFAHLQNTGNVLALEIPGDDHLTAPLFFLSGARSFRLDNWTKTGLRFYSGAASYEEKFNLPSTFLGKEKRVILDCGKVGVVADVWVNGKFVGTRIWEPYQFDITPFVRAGENALKIVVTNTAANASDVGERFPLLQNIDLNGLMGPVKIVPTIQTVLDCRRRP
ncbi:MAG TPA: glycosyl hydrolase [Terriglobia bacterium]|nr:glycosyl hydrolase [Terriglobia bacterium]